ncbi:MAG: oligosaccharide flippase family protein, partial [bacterium]|nr:oligosaccharide flippase family protein [bacterium]
MKTSLKKGTIFLTLSSLIFITSGYIINIFLGRYLGPELYGSYGVLISIITVLNILQTSGFTQAASKYIAEDEKKADSIIASTFRIQIVFTSILAILLFLLSDPIAKALNDRSLSLYIKLSVFILPFYSFYSLLVDYYNGMHYFKKQAILNSIYSISKAILVIFF